MGFSRQSGRTTHLLEAVVDEIVDEGKKVYVVIGAHNEADYMLNLLRVILDRRGLGQHLIKQVEFRIVTDPMIDLGRRTVLGSRRQVFIDHHAGDVMSENLFRSAFPDYHEKQRERIFSTLQAPKRSLFHDEEPINGK